ncbi:hypothetical protein SPHV1_560009 [Novosphingobium sp. KN65.2]|nr:hypothetical protein SPHV1_560009 [Novosphingobium sp. KN65.2]
MASSSSTSRILWLIMPISLVLQDQRTTNVIPHQVEMQSRPLGIGDIAAGIADGSHGLVVDRHQTVARSNPQGLCLAVRAHAGNDKPAGRRRRPGDGEAGQGIAVRVVDDRMDRKLLCAEEQGQGDGRQREHDTCHAQAMQRGWCRPAHGDRRGDDRGAGWWLIGIPTGMNEKCDWAARKSRYAFVMLGHPCLPLFPEVCARESLRLLRNCNQRSMGRPTQLSYEWRDRSRTP